MAKDIHSGRREKSSDLEEEGHPREKSKGGTMGEIGADADKGNI